MGILFKYFIENLVYQLQPTTPNKVLLNGLDKLTGMVDFRIPFLSPPNQDWPECVEGILWR